jgi:hypothetical protein
MLKSEIRREGRVRYVLREKDIMALLTYAYGIFLNLNNYIF